MEPWRTDEGGMAPHGSYTEVVRVCTASTARYVLARPESTVQ